MAQFCKQCGTAHAPDARFCDECGKAVNVAPAPAPVPASAPAAAPALSGVKRRHVIIAGGVLAAVIVAGGALAWLLAPEAASAGSFSRAIDAHLAADEAARDKLLCLTNLPYQKEEIRVASYDSSTRQWLDILVRGGLYAAPVEQSSGGWVAQSQFVYALAAPGKAALRGDKLCVAKGVKVAKVSGYDQVRDLGVQQVAMAKATLTLTDEAAWFAKSPDRALILQRLPDGDLEVRLPMALVDKRWQVIDEAQMSQAAMTGVLGKAPAVQGAGMLDKLKSVFSFGGHPLVGKWKGSKGDILEFTSDSIIENGNASKATFATEDNVVTIVSEEGGGMAMQISLSNSNNTATLTVGGMPLAVLQRVRD
ncbi:zinc ribbon domain-containing protein [Janthinobacterium sp. BJB1]|uniref:zinc ribbon domain-containing protein n=1 Tax=Janthinobacterium sp. GW458P TaxID=1981504 RepID=UPI000A326E66|nr:zinc ribbon domain-containing protein [Janthinobacterium sp. GW458P]MBE3027685.1 zinc ribbon domain-containing protein [Janthinobacterium sp. GW458P]PHV15027.1 zinc ribbon domain-containing protein [Janthinobacterium sp. BJB303]PJC96914.1 zinc ribbon domain-containing protein [Janthinobacterium sp. BJB1]